MLNIYLLRVHLLLDRKFSVIFSFPWLKRNQRHRTVKQKSEYLLLKIFLCACKMDKTNLTMLLFKVLSACKVYSQILWEDKTQHNRYFKYCLKYWVCTHWWPSSWQLCIKHLWVLYSNTETAEYSLSLPEISKYHLEVPGPNRLGNTHNTSAWLDIPCYCYCTP